MFLMPGRNRRRRRGNDFSFGAVVLVALLFTSFIVLRSQVGLFIALGLFLYAVAYGYAMVSRQTVAAHNWHALDRVRLLSGVEFERHVAELYRRLGFHTELTRGSGDQGVDVIATSNDRRIGIQCKQWTSVVGNDAVQQALAGKIFYNCSHAAVVCTSVFTQPAKELAVRSGVELIDGQQYASMVSQFTPRSKPAGIRRWIPRGRPFAVQALLLLLAAAIGFLHAYFVSPSVSRAFSQLDQPPQQRMPLSVYAASTPQSNRVRSEPFSEVIRSFYVDINQKRYEDAYRLLSPQFQAGQPYSSWRAGYNTTLSVHATVVPTSVASVVDVTLTAIDLTPHGTKTTWYAGHFKGGLDASGSWLIDNGSFRVIRDVTRE